jgi:membrane protein implicated in regulation of membrane protease activity
MGAVGATLGLRPVWPSRPSAARIRAVLLLLALLLAFFLLPSPWGWVFVLVAAAWEGFQVVYGLRWARKPKAVGPELLVGSVGEVVDACRPDGTVRVAGELWQAHCEEGAQRGDGVVVTARDELVLTVRRRR